MAHLGVEAVFQVGWGRSGLGQQVYRMIMLQVLHQDSSVVGAKAVNVKITKTIYKF